MKSRNAQTNSCEPLAVIKRSYCKHGLVSSAVDPSDRGYYFDWSAIRTLRRIEGLRSVCGDDFPGIKIILDLMTQLERLQSEVRSTRESTKGAQKGKVH